MPPRIFVDHAFAAGAIVALPEAATRHVKVLRLQPGADLVLFNGSDGAEWPAEITAIGRSVVEVRLGAALPVTGRELALHVTLAVGMPANDRMDGLIEKAGELGATAIQPLLCERSVLRVQGDRAEAKRRHWQGIAVAASEQSGRARVAQVRPVRILPAWLDGLDAGTDDPQRGVRIVLSFAAAALSLATALPRGDMPRRSSIVVLSGPEGGLTSDEEAAAVARGFVRVSLGPRVLRADTAPLAVLAWLGLGASA